MTVICAYTDGTDTWVGSDTAGCCSSGAMLDVGFKWYGDHGWAYGHSGSSRVANIIEANTNDLFEGLLYPLAFTTRLRRLFEEAGLKPVFRDGDPVPSWAQGGMLVKKGAIYDVCGQLSVTEIARRVVWSRGSGGFLADAAAWGAQQVNMQMDPHRLVEIAIEGAAKFDRDIRGCWVEKL